MITFNTILREHGIDPATVKMLRHKVKGKQVLEVWRTDRAIVEEYQRVQGATIFAGTSYVACFMVSRAGDTVFGGLYRVGDFVPAPVGAVNALDGNTYSDRHVLWVLTLEPAFALYEYRLGCRWFLGGKDAGWWQWAHKNPKPVAEIATQQEQPFPGWLEFACPIDELDRLPRAWQEVLRSTSGVYLLTDAVGKHYVGSAKGGDGFLGRWDAYRGGKSGGNVGLKGAVGPFAVSVLQTFDPGLSDQSVERVESLWKDKIGARLIGYNMN